MRCVGAGALVVLLSVASPSARAANPCYDGVTGFDQRAKRTELDTRYPSSKADDLGEGWVLLRINIAPDGHAQDVWPIDAVGSTQFVVASMESVAKSKWNPAVRGGSPTPYSLEFAFQYRMVGENRAGVHNMATRNYDIAYADRRNGNYKASVDVLLRTLAFTLNMYEYATISYGLTVSYMGLGDRRRALRHIRHSAISDAEFADKGQRRSTLALAAELAIQDNSFHEGLCAFKLLKERYPDFVPSAQLQTQVDRATREITSSTPITTDVEMIESLRANVAPVWRHRILRRTLTFSRVQGALTRARVACPTSITDHAFPLSRAVEVDTSAGSCMLYVFGEPGARFVLEER